MLASLHSASVMGVQGFAVEVEVYVAQGFVDHAPVVVGLPDAAVRESRDRVKAALENSGFKHPEGRMTINLAPADIRKEGPIFDLPIALGILAASSQISSERLKDFVVIGELALNGAIRPVRGVLPMALLARERKKRAIIVPAGNAAEAAVVDGVAVYAMHTLREVTDFIEGKREIMPISSSVSEFKNEGDLAEHDFADVKGQKSAKRALEIAVAGGHNVLLIGPPGSGKSMLSKRLPSIMPPLSLHEALEVTKIHSVAGLLRAGEALVHRRPFRSPHHTISDIGLIGGSSQLNPGEVSFAHHGVLFLDELPEFKRSALECLRQPLEDGEVTISRAAGSLKFPAQFMLIAAMNPTPTGNFDDEKRGKISVAATQRYLNKISAPLLDRIDIHLEVRSLGHKEIMEQSASEPSAPIRERVMVARKFQIERFTARRNILCNSQMDAKELRKHVPLDTQSRELMKQAMTDLGLSARAYDRILKVARTIADLAQSASVRAEHLSEAISLRTLDRQIW